MAWNDSFDDMVSADLDSAFFGTSEFADSIVVIQRDEKPRPITAQVIVNGAMMDEGQKHQDQSVTLHVMSRTDPVTGISNASVGDYVIWEENEYEYVMTKSADRGVVVNVFRKIEITQHGRNRPPTL